jgi:hypothetical protein
MPQSSNTTVPPVQPPGAQVPGVDPVNAAIDGLVTNFIEYGLILVSVATIAMAFLELLKAVTRARLWFHRWRVRKWIQRSSPAGVDTVYRQLLALAASDVKSDSGLFDQSTDKMMGQVQAAANVAMDFPTTYSALYAFLTHPPEAPPPVDDGATKQKAATGADPTATDQALWGRFAAKMQEAPEVMARAAVTSDGPTAESIAANNARARLDHFVARKLDAFQSSAEYEWARLNQLVAVFGSAAVLMYVLSEVEPNLAKRAVMALFGGMIAPFAKDFVSALQRLRG